MHTNEPSATDHPLLARLPIAAGAVGLRALRADDIDDLLVFRGEACTQITLEKLL